jgi:ectoine hydroxylase-related dioxygenase (phytanoyl-CoA dioxygenase family)
VEQEQIDRHIDELDVLGYTVLPDVLPLDTAAEARAEIERLYRDDPGVRAKRTDEYATYHIECLMNKGEIFETYFLNPAVLPFAEHFLGADYIAQDVWSFGVPPGAPAYRLHADDDVRTPGVALSVVTIYPLVDFTEGNGATRLIPGTHRRPDYPLRDHDYPGEITVEAPVGSCVVLFGSLWHSSGANRSGQIRTSMSCYFSRPWIKQYVDIPAVIAPEVLKRATPQARKIFGFPARTPFTERWQWDREAGEPLSAPD